MSTDNPASHPLCNAQYQRIGGNQPGDRVVECGRPRGHEGFHVEYCDGEDVNNWPPLSSVAVPPSDQGHRSDPHISENGSCRCNCPKCMTGKVCICPACHSPFHDHDPRPAATPPAGPPDDLWWVARGEYQKAMDEADRLTIEAAGITAAAEAAWLAFARGYLKERKVDHV